MTEPQRRSRYRLSTVGTAKRERQKANKAKREQEIARAEAKSRTTRIAVLVAGAVIAVFALVYIAGQFIGDDDDEQSPVPSIDTVVEVDEPVTDSVDPVVE